MNKPINDNNKKPVLIGDDGIYINKDPSSKYPKFKLVLSKEAFIRAYNKYKTKGE